jgi:hypothetical protein
MVARHRGNGTVPVARYHAGHHTRDQRDSYSHYRVTAYGGSVVATDNVFTVQLRSRHPYSTGRSS